MPEKTGQRRTLRQVEDNAIRALRKLAEWHPECGYPEHCGLAYQFAYDEHAATEAREWANMAPFFSEAYLYELLGKEDARTLMALLNSVARVLGHPEGVC